MRRTERRRAREVIARVRAGALDVGEALVGARVEGDVAPVRAALERLRWQVGVASASGALQEGDVRRVERAIATVAAMLPRPRVISGDRGVTRS